MLEVASVVVPVTVKRPVVVLFTKLDEVAKRLDDVELVVDALVAAKLPVVVALPLASTLKLTFSVHALPFQ